MTRVRTAPPRVGLMIRKWIANPITPDNPLQARQGRETRYLHSFHAANVPTMPTGRSSPRCMTTSPSRRARTSAPAEVACGLTASDVAQNAASINSDSPPTELTEWFYSSAASACECRDAMAEAKSAPERAGKPPPIVAARSTEFPARSRFLVARCIS